MGTGEKEGLHGIIPCVHAMLEKELRPAAEQAVKQRRRMCGKSENNATAGCFQRSRHALQDCGVRAKLVWLPG
ncbi:hypothetical protein CFter6_4517 [Collimonas fungivorans]|uniref:Uncharacterized protein n=1 Tax=Collimonas fungivorans TaxID=158899 RepID=A0A127PH19_9BURK|nr:hypothetical protein CFter6_4517 [Collimonas fungivorans]